MKTLIIHCTVLAVIILAAFACYHHTFNVPFVFDDLHAIVENQKIRDLGNYLAPESIISGQRPLTEITFALNYHFGGLEVSGFHQFNLAIHILSAFIVYFLALILFRRLGPSNDDSSSGWYRSVIPAAFTALIFVLHPVQTQAVTYIVQRYASMAAMFYLAAVLCYILGRQAMQAWAGAVSIGIRHYVPFKSIALFFLCFLFGLASFLSKQIALSLPLAILLIEYLLFDRTWSGWKKKLAVMVPVFTGFLLFVLYSAGVLQGDISLGRILEETDQRTRETLEVGRLQYLFTQFEVVAIYLGILIWPANLSLDYMYPYVDDFFQGWTFWALILHLVLISAAVFMRRSFPLVTMGILWFYITLSVESSLIPITDVLFEHRLYLPMFGFAVIAGWAFLEVYRRWQAPAIVLSLSLLMLLSVATYQRNTVWQSPVSLWADTIEARPENPRAHNNLGQALEDRQRMQEAFHHYQEALKLDPDYADAHLNMGLVLARSGRIDQAENHFIQAAKLRPGLAKAHYNLGLVRQTRNRHHEAIKHYQRALHADPEKTRARLNLAGALAETDRPYEAIEHLKRILDAHPDHFDALMNKGILLYMTGDADNALEVLDQALTIEPESVQALMNQGIILMRTGRPDQAIRSFSSILELDPENSQARQLLFRSMQEAGKSPETN